MKKTTIRREGDEMAWLLFLDESGHDHKQMPNEVRGGIALQDGQLWPFTRDVQKLERFAFGCALHEFQKELKGSNLLDKNDSSSPIRHPHGNDRTAEAQPRISHKGVAEAHSHEQRILRLRAGMHRDGARNL
jgi:hypothetical protein